MHIALVVSLPTGHLLRKNASLRRIVNVGFGQDFLGFALSREDGAANRAIQSVRYEKSDRKGRWRKTKEQEAASLQYPLTQHRLRMMEQS